MKIAVLISSLVFDSQRAFMKGIERRVRDWGDTCSVFCCHVNIAENDSYAKGEYSIFGLPDFSRFDGVIFVRNTIQNPTEESILVKKIAEANVPCVSVDAVTPEFVSVISDEVGIARELTNHLIEAHGCKRLYFLGGQESSNDTNKRFQGFLEALRAHDLEFRSEWRSFGNFEYSSGATAADYFADLDETPPDAVVCSNDEMAVGLIIGLKKRGFKIPKDIKVTGIDYDSVSRVFYPKVTTAKRQQYQKAVDSINILHEYEKHTPGEVITLPIALAFGDSCGCKVKPEGRMDITTVNTLAVDRYSAEEVTQTIKRMSAALMERPDFDGLVDELKQYGCTLNADELYLCLNIRPNVIIDYSDYTRALSSIERSNMEDYSDKIESVVTIIDGALPIEDGSEVFDRGDLFPPIANGGRSGATYYFMPIHYINRNFGYAILGTNGELVRNEFFPNWCTIASNALENLRKRNLMEQMIDALDHMWIYDTLTGIYNRAGFFKLSEKLLDNSLKDGSPVSVIFLDVDGLKEINDKYGHDMGDLLIKDAASVLKNVKKHDELIMRYGGDEFVLLGVNLTEDDVKERISMIEASMHEINASGNRPYELEASVGYCRTKLNNLDELNNLIDTADHEMYKNKKSKKALNHKEAR